MLSEYSKKILKSKLEAYRKELTNHKHDKEQAQQWADRCTVHVATCEQRIAELEKDLGEYGSM